MRSCKSTVRTQSREAVSRAQARIREAVTRNRQDKLTALLHHVNIEVLRASFFGLKKTAAPGVDERTWIEYAEHLEANLVSLHVRIHTGAYRALPPLVDPLIIDMMEVNVRQERFDDRALRRPLLRLDQVSIFEHACRQPFGNRPDNSPVTNPMFDEADQPILVNLVEKGLNVAIEYPVDPPLRDPERERIQRLMLVTLRSETVADAQELRLIDRRQNCHHRSLDNLVLYGSDAERPLSAICLRYVLPA